MKKSKKYQYSIWQDLGEKLEGKPAIAYQRTGYKALVGIYGLIGESKGDMIFIRCWDYSRVKEFLPTKSKKDNSREMQFRVNRDQIDKWYEVLKIIKDTKSQLVYANQQLTYFPMHQGAKYGRH